MTHAANYLYKKCMVLWQQPQNLPPSDFSTTGKLIFYLCCFQPTTTKLNDIPWHNRWWIMKIIEATSHLYGRVTEAFSRSRTS